MVGRQPNAPAAFTPGEIHGTHFQRLSRPQGTWVPRKKSPVTPPEIDPGTVRLVAQRLNQYATPGPNQQLYIYIYIYIYITARRPTVFVNALCSLTGKRLRLLVKQDTVVWLFHWPIDHVFVRFVGAVTNLRKAATSFVMYVCLNVCPSFRLQQLNSHWTKFHRI